MHQAEKGSKFGDLYLAVFSKHFDECSFKVRLPSCQACPDKIVCSLWGKHQGEQDLAFYLQQRVHASGSLWYVLKRDRYLADSIKSLARESSTMYICQVLSDTMVRTDKE